MLEETRRVGALAIAASSLVLALSACGGEHSKKHSPPTRPTPRSLRPSSIAFWDARNGLIGTGVTWRKTTGTISRTSDGGRTYRVALRTKGPVSWVSAAGSSDAWAVAGRCTTSSDCVSAEFLHSTDRGSTWQSVPDPGILRVSFADSSHGLAIAKHGKLLTTSDGGRTWAALTRPCSKIDSRWVALSDELFVSLATPQLAWAVCVNQPSAGSQPKTVYRTVDGGKTWAIVADQSIFHSSGVGSGGLAIYGYPAGVSFSPQGSGLIWEDRGTLDLSRDGGRHWKALRIAEPEVDSGESAQMLSETGGFALLLNPDLGYRLVATADGGRTWTAVHRWPLRTPS